MSASGGAAQEGNLMSDIECIRCGKEIPDGEEYTTFTVSREKIEHGAVTTIDAEAIAQYCSDCLSFSWRPT